MEADVIKGFCIPEHCMEIIVIHSSIHTNSLFMHHADILLCMMNSNEHRLLLSTLISTLIVVREKVVRNQDI